MCLLIHDYWFHNLNSSFANKNHLVTPDQGQEA